MPNLIQQLSHQISLYFLNSMIYKSPFQKFKRKFKFTNPLIEVDVEPVQRNMSSCDEDLLNTRIDSL